MIVYFHVARRYDQNNAAVDSKRKCFGNPCRLFNARAASSTVADDCDNSITALPSAAKKCLTFSIVIGYGYRWR